MVTGASTADLAIVLVDARNGVVEQTRRHAFIASLLGIPHVVVAVNKMDLVDYDEEAFDAIVREFCALPPQLAVRDTTFIPLSALHGDNVVERSEAMPWYGGLPLLEHLETVEIAADRNLDRRCASRCSGSSATGATRLPRLRGPGRRRRAAPRRRGASCCPSERDHDGRRRRHLRRARSRRPSRRCPSRVRLADDVDVSRGDLICRPDDRAGAGARARGRRLLDGRRAAAPRRPLRDQARHAQRRGRSSTRSSTASTSTRLRRDPAPAELGAQRHRPRAPAHLQAAGLRPLRAQPHDRLVHPHRRGHERHGRRGHDHGARNGAARYRRADARRGRGAGGAYRRRLRRRRATPHREPAPAPRRAAAAADPCASSRARRDHSLRVLPRTPAVIVHVPDGLRAGLRVPLVLGLHGAGQDARGFEAESDFIQVADEHHFVVAYPMSWRARGFWHYPEPDNPRSGLRYLRATLDAVARTPCVDAAACWSPASRRAGG